MNRAMKTIAVLILAGSLGACAGLSRTENTALGAVGGAVAGSALTGGSALGTVGGAVAGGVIGHETSPRRR